MNKILLIFSSILILSLVSSIYPGESQVYPNTFGSENLVLTIIENTSELSVLPVVLVNTTNITISIPSDFPPNSFKLIFLDNYTQEVVNTIVVSSGSSGGHSTRTITKYVNQTKEVEVPKYISVPNNTIEYVNQTKEVEKIVEVNKIPLLGWIVIIGGLASIIVLIIGLWMDHKSNSSEIKERTELEGGQE